MPAKSKSQQRFMGMVRQCQKTGECASTAVKKAADSISTKDAKKFAKTKQKGLPEKVSEGMMTFREFIISENIDKSGFREYMQMVDRILTNKVGMDHMDLPDYMWMGAFEDGIEPQDAVQDFIENQDGEMDFAL